MKEISRDRVDDIAGIAFQEPGRAGAAVHPIYARNSSSAGFSIR